MTLRARSVAIRQLPETTKYKQGRMFLRELEECLNVDRPRIVIECSQLREMNWSAIHLLLCCLEAAMKKNGDVRLAALPPDGPWMLEVAGAIRLFEIFETADEAVASFRRPGIHSRAWHSSAKQLAGHAA